MATFFFDVDDGMSPPDDTGTDCDGLLNARLTALRLACDILHDAPLRFWNRDDCAIVVRDDTRRLLFSLEISLKERIEVQSLTSAA